MPGDIFVPSLPYTRSVRYNRGMNAICLVLDRLHAGYVGAYGNSWIETPALDRLASRSLVFDRALVDSPELERLYRSYWQGWHALCPAGGGAAAQRWPPCCARPACRRRC